MAKAGRNGADIVLRKKDGTSEVPLELFQGGDIPGGYRSKFAALQAQQITSGLTNSASQPPESGLVWPSRGWDNGAGQVYFRDSLGPDTGADERRYAHSDGVLAMFPGKSILGYQEDWCDTTLQNGRGSNVGAYATTADLLDEALDDSETGVNVDDGDYYSVGDIIQVGSEKMKVTAISTNTLTVVRGVVGSIAADHLNNAAVERQGATGWDDNSNITAIFTSSDSRTGDYGIKFKASAAGYLGQRYKGSAAVLAAGVGPPTVTFVGYAKRVVGSGTLIPRLVTDEGGTTNGSAVSADTYTFFTSGAHTLNASDTTLDFRLVTSAANDVWVVDDMAVIISNANGEWTKMVRFKGSNSNHEFYAASGRAIYKWDEGDDAFYAVHVSDSANDISDLESFDDSGTAGVLYAGRGTGDNYLRSTDGATFSDPTSPTGNAAKAELFLKVRNANGDSALMKTRTNKAAFTTDASTTANWGTEIKVGDVDHAVTSVFSVNDAGYVGKEDGLWVYNPVDNLFEDIEPDANFFPHPNNYKRVMGRGGFIWAQGGDHSLFRLTPIDDDNNFAWEDVSELVSFPEWPGFGGGIRALGQDRQGIWLMTDGADKELTRSSVAIAQTGTSRASSTDTPNYDWTARNPAYSLSTAISAIDGAVVQWDGEKSVNGALSDHMQFEMGINNLAIPNDATITGIQKKFIHTQLFSGTFRWNDVKLLKGGVAAGGDRGLSASYTGSETIFGGESDLWDTTWTAAQCNATDFGSEAQIEFVSGSPFTRPYIDAVETTVFYTTSGSDTSRVMTLRQNDAGFASHTVSIVLLENPDRVARAYDAANTLSNLFVLGRTNNGDASLDELRAYRFRMPVADQDPTALQVPALRRSGYIVTPWMDYSFPDVNKGMLSLQVLSSNCEADERTITASYKIDNASNDDDSGWTTWGDSGATNDGVFNVSPSETQLALLTTPQAFKRIRLRFDFETDDITESPSFEGFVLKVAWNPNRVGSREWDVQATIGTAPASAPQRSSQRYPALLTDLDTLAGEAFIEMEEYRGAGDNTVVTHTVTITQMTESFFRHETQGGDGTAEQQRVITLSLTEMDV